MEKVQWMKFSELADYDYGVKGFEIRFQKMIEDYLDANNINSPWWKFYKNDLFSELMAIYLEEDKNKNHMILTNLHKLYLKVLYEVTDAVQNHKNMN